MVGLIIRKSVRIADMMQLRMEWELETTALTVVRRWIWWVRKMKEYKIEVTSTTTVYIEADNEEAALMAAYHEALNASPDFYDSVIVDVVDTE